MTHHFGAARSQRAPAQSPGLSVGPLGQVILLFGTCERGVGGHQSGELAGPDQAHDFIQRVEGQVRGHLDQHGLGGAAARQFRIHRLHRREDVVQGRLVLKLSQVGRVRRTHIDHEEIGQVPQGAERLGVFGGGLIQWRDFGLAQIDAHGMRGPQSLSPPSSQALGQCIRAAIVEAHPVDEGSIGHVPEHPGLGIARLCVAGHPAQFAEAESEGLPHRHGDGLLVHAGGQPHWVGETQSHSFNRQRGCLKERLGQLARPGDVTRLGQQPEGLVVDRFGVLGEEERAGDVAIQPTHVTARLPGMPPFGQMGFL